MITILVVATGLLLSLNIMIKAISADLKQYNQEGECIQKYINMGIPRKYIKASDGSCVVLGIKKGKHRTMINN